MTLRYDSRLLRSDQGVIPPEPAAVHMFMSKLHASTSSILLILIFLRFPG